MKKRLANRVAAILFALTLVLTGVLSFDFGMGEVKAGSGTYSVTYALANGVSVDNANLEIQFLDSGSNSLGSYTAQVGTSYSRTTHTINGSVPDNTAKVKIKAITAGKQLAASKTLTVAGADKTGEIAPALTDGGQEFVMGPNDNLTVSLTLENGGGGGGGAPVDAVSNGNYQITITQDGTNCSGKIYFTDNNGTRVGSEMNLSASQAVTSIPDGATKLCVDFSANDETTENNRLHVKNCSLFEFAGGVNQSGPIGIDGNNAIQYKDEQHNGCWVQNIDRTSRGYHLRLEFSDKKNVQLDGAANCQLYFADAAGNIEAGVRDKNLTMGQTYYFKLIPDYGYQVRSLVINEWYTLTPQDAATGLFAFTMNAHNLHFQGLVTPAEDITDTSGATGVSGVTIGDGANATANGGNLKVTVTDAAAPVGVSSVAAGTVLSTVDIDIDNVVSKGNGQYWSSDVTEIANPINVGLQMNPATTPAGTYAVVRNHNGVLTSINANYDAATGILSFPSDAFSTYTIVRTGDVSDAPAAAATASAPAADPVFVAAANDPAKTGAIYIGKAELPPATSITALEGVTVTGINPITDQNAIAALTGEYSMLWNKSRGLGANERTFAFDLAASGSGKVAFYVGTGSPSAAVISHYHGGMWTRQIVDVVNGQAVGTFRDFSPMFITVYEGVTADQVRAAGITDTEGATATVGAKSPKTKGTSSVIWMTLVIALAGAGAVALRKRA